MSKRSDLAQKLLDDLRLRKERMGLAQATERPEPRVTDANSRWSFRGSGERISKRRISGRQTLGAEITQKTQSARYSRTSMPEEASKEIVAVSRAGRSKQPMDLSRVLTIALSYGGKNLNWDLYSNSSNKRFILQQTSVNFGRRENRHQPSTIPYVSQIHLDEISKCADKINRILKACSSGLKLDRQSIDIGRELLRGAIDLEESLRMLASLQEASEYMVNPQRKQMRLLKEKGDEDEPSTSNREKQMALSRPRLSVYGTQHSFENGRQQAQKTFFDIGKQTIKPKPGKHTDESVKIIYRGKRTSSGRSFEPETPFSATRNDSGSEKTRTSSDSKAFMATVDKHNTSNHTIDTGQLASQVNSGHEKWRIPSVIAKLMGLEDLPPPNTESKKSGHKVTPSIQGTRVTTNLRPNAEETKGVHTAVLAERTSLRRKVIQEKQSTMTRAIKNVEAVKSKEKTNLRATGSASPVTKGSEKLLFKNDTSDGNRKRKMLLQKEHSTVNETCAKGKENETKEVIILKDTQDTQFDSPTTTSKPYRHPHNEHMNQEFPGRLRNAQKDAKGSPMQVSQLNHSQDERPVQPNAAQQSEVKSRDSKKEQKVKNESELTNKTRSAPKKPHNTKSIHEIRSERLASKGTSIIVNKSKSISAIDKKQDKISLKSRELENITIRGTRTIDHQFDKKSANDIELGRALRMDPKSKKENGQSLVPKYRSIPSIKTEQNARTGLHENGNAEKRQEETDGSQSPNASDHPVKQNISIFEEMTQEKESNGRAEEEIISLHPSNMKQHLQDKAQSASHCDNPVVDDHMMPNRKIGEAPTDTDSHETIIHTAPVQQSSETSIQEDQEFHFFNVIENPIPGSTDSKLWHTSNSNSFKEQDKAVSKFDKQELLTDGENHLKEILTRSHLFLNNAQALFNIQVPVSIIQVGKSECQSEQSKITLDCGYEVMRRKGKREELVLLSAMKISSATAKVRCLDDLIKELENDLESLKFSCLNEDYFDTSEFLHKMLEREIHNSNPDVNCMWDFSWQSLTFASTAKNEVIRDVEKHVLNGLINDIVKDLLNGSISA